MFRHKQISGGLAAGLVFVLLGAFVTTAAASSLLDDFTRGLEGLSGQFEQRVYDQDGRLDEKSRGEVALAVPQRFRWEYQAPFPQLIVADGERIWIFDPDLEQAQVRPQGDDEDAGPLLFLADPSQLERQYAVHEEGEADGLTWLRLEPLAEEAPFSSTRLGFSGLELQRMEMLDALGQRTEVRFSGWQRNPAFPADYFRFLPPPGVDVIGDPGEPAQTFGLPSGLEAY